MDFALLSRLNKDYLNREVSAVSEQMRYRAGWSGSVMVPHKGAKKHLRAREFWTSPSPKLAEPKEMGDYKLAAPRYFSKGAAEFDRKRYPDPIPYLLSLGSEMPSARPVPGSIGMMRSLCKGKGVLRRNASGLVYLDIDPKFVATLLPYLTAQGLMEPPFFQLPSSAHVPVVSPREAAFHYLEEIPGLGKEITFEIEGLFSIEPAQWSEVEQVWFFKLHSEELENFRRSLFLSSVPNGHPFHIAVAIKPRSRFDQGPKPMMQINPAVTAA